MGEVITVEDVATRYDRETSGPLFARYRDLSMRELVGTFAPRQRVLEIGCGTGTEAIELASRGVLVLATDVMEEMVTATASRARTAGVEEMVEARRLAAREVGTLADELGEGALDGAFSSFGALNCEPELEPVIEGLQRLLRPGAPLLVSVMNKTCLWEIAAYMATLRPAMAFRRLHSLQGRVAGRTFDVYYHTVSDLLRDFAGRFRLVRRRGYGLLPPPYLEGAMSIFPRFLDVARNVDPWPMRGLGDHHFLTMERA